MLILVIGQGAREHAIVTSLLKDKNVNVVCAPGNPGIAQIARTVAVNPIAADEVLALAKQVAADLVVIGPEAPLVAGVADILRDHGFKVFGPSSAAAQLEGSKAFAKEVMQEAGVATAASSYCVTVEEARHALEKFGAPYVVKDDGLAAGKGVVVTHDFDVAIEHALACIDSRDGGAVVIEEFLAGPEISLFGVCDGTKVIPLSPAQDFKRVRDNDEGPNTGGMGAYTPLPWAPKNLVNEVTQNVLQPMVDQMAKRKTPFVGLLYAGLVLTKSGVKVIEFNVRFGDPETQVVLARLDSSLSELLLAAADGKLAQLPEPNWKTESAVTVVMAAEGYPEKPVLGAPISGLEDAISQGAKVFHAGTALDHTGNVVVNGGRVLSITGVGIDLADARRRAYQAVETIKFAGEHHRTDIALTAVKEEIQIP